MPACVALTTAPDRKTAQRLASGLVRKRLAACVNILPGAVSNYFWKGRIARSREALLFIKTTSKAWPRVAAYLKEHHPYELPEAVAWPVTLGSREYLSWIEKNVSK